MDEPKSFARTFCNSKYFFPSKIYINQNGSVHMNVKWMLLNNSKKLANTDNFLAFAISSVKAD